jgi:hypothetical protein
MITFLTKLMVKFGFYKLMTFLISGSHSSVCVQMAVFWVVALCIMMMMMMMMMMGIDASEMHGMSETLVNFYQSA